MSQQPWGPQQQPYQQQPYQQHGGQPPYGAYQQGPYGQPQYGPPTAPTPPKPGPLAKGCGALVGLAVFAIVATLVIAVLADSNDDTDTEATPSAPATQPLSDNEINRVAMLAVIRSKYPKWKNAPDQQIVDLGNSACSALRAGNSTVSVGSTMATRMDIPLGEAGYVLGAMVTALCPDQESKVRSGA